MTYVHIELAPLCSLNRWPELRMGLPVTTKDFTEFVEEKGWRKRATGRERRTPGQYRVPFSHTP